jgi:predicted Zn-dependent protease
LEDRIEYVERMLADNPDNPTGLLALANKYNKVERYEDEAAVLERYVASHERERTERQHSLWLRFSAPLSGDNAGRVEPTRA